MDFVESICYWGYGGGFLCYGKGKSKEEGGGFMERDKILMEVNLEEGFIQWIVNSKVRCSIELPILKHPNL